ncbi:MAG: hypothetical protein ACW9W3_01060 [Candidatus Nitrosopumilus sp. bin_68KS]
MINSSHSYFLPAVAQGLFFVILSKTGIDISPSGISLILLKVFEPIIPEQIVSYLPTIEFALYFAPLLSLIGVIYHHGKYGLVGYVAITVVSFVFFSSMWK